MAMHLATMIFNRQVIRLCKGIIKAWEQWVDDVELEGLNPASDSVDAPERNQEIKHKDVHMQGMDHDSSINQ